MARIKTLAPFRWWPRVVRGLAATSLAASCLAAEAPTIPDYQIGDPAEADVVTPIPLVVFDAARTESLRKAEAQKVPPIFRFHAEAGREAEAALRAGFADARLRFAGNLERLFGHSLPLLTTELADPQFTDFVETFRKENPPLPLADSLAELWALGDSGDVALDGLLANLRPFANACVREDALPPGERLTTGSVRLIAVEPTNNVLTLAVVDKRGKNLARTNLISLAKIRQDVRKSGPPDELESLKFTAGFLRPNCFFDEELTRQARTRRSASINAADHYAAGQRIVGRGEIISPKTKLALDELRSRTSAERAQATAVLEQSKAEAQAAAAQRAAEETRRTNRWLIAGFSAAVIGFAILAWLGFRRRRLTALVPLDSTLAVMTQSDAPMDDADWRERALAAEARAQKATALLRANLLPHLARWMMNEVVQRLLSQRSGILTSQQNAEREVAELAERLEQVHAPLEDRLRAYEKRIAELEAELAAKGEQNLDLIKTKIETTRKKLEGERSQDRLDWN